jgi:hypothetical protein
MTVRPVVAAALAIAIPFAVVGCSEAEGPDPAPHADATADDAEVKVVEKDQADLVLYASNQSFDDEKVHLTISVDHVTVVSGEFFVADQHNWISFPLSMSPGTHEVTAESDSGATLRESFEVPGDKTRYALIGRPLGPGSIAAPRARKAAWPDLCVGALDIQPFISQNFYS